MPRHADPALPARRRAQILEAARYCFHARGFRLTTIEEICAEARVSPGALYRYFDAKADIIAAIALDARAEAEAMLDRLGAGDALIDALAEMARAFFEAFEAPEAALLADIWAEAARDPDLARALSARDAALGARLASAITRAARTGAIHPALAPEEAAETLLAALEGMALRRALRPAPDGARRFRALALHLLKPKR
ncbi:MAG TPA: TetR/AcrR family transcriptional regulator [Terricaulis sp.]|nr:TetR/AcrR family transcriptional regulator [Terricaulis sp.]